MRWFVALVILTLCSCSVLDTVKELREDYQAIKTEVRQAKADIDKNMNGKLDADEIVTWTLGGGAAGLIGVILAIIRNSKSNDRKTRTELEVANIKEKLAALPGSRPS